MVGLWDHPQEEVKSANSLSLIKTPDHCFIADTVVVSLQGLSPDAGRLSLWPPFFYSHSIAPKSALCFYHNEPI